MYKNLSLLFALLVAGTSASAQGYVDFTTQTLGVRVYDSVIDPTGGTAGALVGNDAGAQLFAAPGVVTDDSFLRPIGMRVNFRLVFNAGYVVTVGNNKWGERIDPWPTIPGTIDTETGRVVTIQMRAWDAAFATYEEALAGGGRTGKSNIIQMSAQFPPASPPRLIGLESFAINVIPEPSTVGLASVGFGCFLIAACRTKSARRRKSIRRLY